MTALRLSQATAHRGAKQGVLLGWGFAASVLLVLISTVFSVLQMSRAKSELMQLFEASERSTYLIGHIGQQLSRMRLLLREELDHVTGSGEAPGGSLASLDATVRESLKELQPLLNAGEAQLWNDLEPALLRVRADLGLAAEALERGEAQRARPILAGLVPLAAQLMDGLASLYRLNREGTRAALREADERLRLMRMAVLMVSCVLVIGITATWWIVIRLVRRQREQLDRYVVRVETANADLNAFAGRTAHDLRNVLSPLLLAVGALKLAPGDGSRVAAISQRIERIAARGLALLDALLDFSRAGEASGRDAVCSVRTELLAVVEELTPMAERIGAKVEVVMEPSTDPKVKCSAGLCGIVVRNIVGNAVKFSDGSPKRQVRVSVRTIQNEWCDIAVEDSGPGIPSEAMGHIFEPFYRAPGAAAPGTGIGLATVQRIVHAHGGRVAVNSTLGEGTRVDLRLPLAAV